MPSVVLISHFLTQQVWSYYLSAQAAKKQYLTGLLVELQAEVVNLKKLRLLQLKNQANALDKVPCGGGQNIDNMDTLPMDETFYDAPLSQHQAG